VANPDWGKKQTCPKCGERFYDLGKENPNVCIACAHEWVPEPILKTKQPIAVKKEEPKKAEEADSNDDDDIDLDDDDDAVVSLDDDDDEDVAAIVDTSLADKED